MSFDQTDSIRDLLTAALSAAVPLHIYEMRNMSFEERRDIAQSAAQVIAEKGDIIQFKSKKRGETASAFNWLARGLAALAYAPGGVTFLGMHFVAPTEQSKQLDAEDLPGKD